MNNGQATVRPAPADPRGYRDDSPRKQAAHRRQGEVLLVLAGCFSLIGLLTSPGAADPQPAQQQVPPATSAPPGGSALHSQLMSKIHQVNQMEIKAGKLARSQGLTAEVRAYGDLLVRDYTVADCQVMNLAEKQGIPIGEPMPKNAEEKEQMNEQLSMMDQLQTLQGREFDQKFLGFMQKGHKMAIKTLCSARGRLPPSPLLSLIETLIPILRQHYEIAIGVELDEIIRGGD